VQRRLFLLSNSTNHGSRYLEHAAEELLEFLRGERRILFVPFALHDERTYWERVSRALADTGLEVDRLARDDSAPDAIGSARAVFVGGGNTFRLLDKAQRTEIIEPLRRRVASGMPYVGSSAGTVISAPTLKTTNDMPIVAPSSFESLGLVPFQINCHYVEGPAAPGHMGETRDDRIAEYLEENEPPVLAMREGAWLRVEDDAASLGGTAGARLFRRGEAPRDLLPGDDLSALLA